ncbi:hypothetical protein BBK36DRAFT_5235 [Trichoderma citrinoviride]|uniref:CFEM domain-containing protein n=1 Tax=Trichoderma citrinoviride TaxID=58853 RepID=A0A2T4B978_9HYPO|nr:hypothetical protein BBK36DRAFT_5235 [Trichoderma citrinoviride]PTB65887.1 hypothetical protein BBK36DRAFT_5235 [Trichoderma citrinoviride]
MKFALAIVSFAAAVYGQTASDIPSCALGCFQTAITSVTDCAAMDYACACNSADAVAASGQSCVIAACGEDVAENQAFPAFQALCNAQ